MHAKLYAEDRQMLLTGWRYPQEGSLEQLVQDKKVFPVTILKTDMHVKKVLMSRNMITIQDIISAGEDKLTRVLKDGKLAKGILGQAKKLSR